MCAERDRLLADNEKLRAERDKERAACEKTCDAYEARVRELRAALGRAEVRKQELAERCGQYAAALAKCEESETRFAHERDALTAFDAARGKKPSCP